MVDPMVLDRAFAGPGARESAGALRIRTGQVVAYDPLGDRPRRPFTVPVPPGDHPVVVVNDGGGVLLTFAAGRPVSWELAVTDGQDVSRLGPGEIYGYPVGCGLSCFADPEAAALFNRELDAFDDPFDELEDYLYTDEQHWVSHVIGRLPVPSAVPVANPHGYNIVVVRAGYGDDGTYATWVGRDADNHPLCLLTNFALDR